MFKVHKTIPFESLLAYAEHGKNKQGIKLVKKLIKKYAHITNY